MTKTIGLGVSQNASIICAMVQILLDSCIHQNIMPLCREDFNMLSMYSTLHVVVYFDLFAVAAFVVAVAANENVGDCNMSKAIVITDKGDKFFPRRQPTFDA